VSPHENGDVEQRNHRLKKAVDQALKLRGSYNFVSFTEYDQFLHKMFCRLNAGRKKRLDEELPLLHALPARRFESIKRLTVRVSAGSTISIQGNVYSLHSRLRGEQVEARISGETIAVWYGQKKIDEYPRFRGRGHARIDYRHIIDVFVTKPGAFDHYRYRAELFPTHYYRLAYDSLASGRSTKERAKEYLRILKLAADHGEKLVEQSIKIIIDHDEELTSKSVEAALMHRETPILQLTQTVVAPVDLTQYDRLCAGGSF
jgi:hypothetical protein